MLNIEIHIQAINACSKCINNSIMLNFNLGNHLLQIIYSTALLDHKPSSVKKMEIGPALPFVHISITQHVPELTLPSPFSVCKALSSHLEGGILHKNPGTPRMEEQAALCGTWISTEELCAGGKCEEGKHSVCLTRSGTNSSLPPWCLGSYSFIIKDFGQSTVVVIIT